MQAAAPFGVWGCGFGEEAGFGVCVHLVVEDAGVLEGVLDEERARAIRSYQLGFVV